MRMLSLDMGRKDLKQAWTLFRLQLNDKYLGSRLGTLWAIVNPLLLVLVFIFVFGRIFKVAVPEAESPLSYAIWLIGGYGPWIAMSEAMMASSISIVANGGLVKNLPLKTELLPFAAVLTGFVPLVVTIGALVILLAIDGRTITWHILFIPVAAGLQFMLILGLGFITSALTVFIRDFQFILPNLLTAILFATPIVYPLESASGFIKTFSAWNPFFVVAESYRAVLIRHQIPDLIGLGYLAVVGVIIGMVGLNFFRRCKGYFGARL